MGPPAGPSRTSRSWILMMRLPPGWAEVARTQCSAFPRLCPAADFLMTKCIGEQSAALFPSQSPRHSRGEILRFRSPGIQTTNKTAVTRAPLAGRNAFQAHRKEAWWSQPGWIRWPGRLFTSWLSSTTWVKARSSFILSDPFNLIKNANLMLLLRL